MKSFSCVRLFVTPWTVVCTRLLHSWDFLGKSTGVSCHFLLQGLFPDQGLNPGLWHCRRTPYCLSYQGTVGEQMAIQPVLERALEAVQGGWEEHGGCYHRPARTGSIFLYFFFNMVKCTPLHIADGCRNWYYFFGKKLAIYFKSQKLSLYSVI